MKFKKKIVWVWGEIFVIVNRGFAHYRHCESLRQQGEAIYFSDLRIAWKFLTLCESAVRFIDSISGHLFLFSFRIAWFGLLRRQVASQWRAGQRFAWIAIAMTIRFGLLCANLWFASQWQSIARIHRTLADLLRFFTFTNFAKNLKIYLFYKIWFIKK